jgi:hypothetical protein
MMLMVFLRTLERGRSLHPFLPHHAEDVNLPGKRVNAVIVEGVVGSLRNVMITRTERAGLLQDLR